MARAFSRSVLSFSSVSFAASPTFGLSPLAAFEADGERSSQRCLPSGKKVKLTDSPACTKTSQPPGTEARLVTNHVEGSEATVSHMSWPVDGDLLLSPPFWACADTARQAINSAARDRRRHMAGSLKRSVRD